MKRLYLSAFLGICVVNIFSNDVFATAEDLIAFKKRHAAYVAENDIAAIGDFGKIIKLKKGEAPVEIAKIVTFMEADTVPRAWLEWFKRTYREQKQISYKKFAAAVFYPYEILETTHKQHFQQMNYAFKVSFMYSSEFDASGPARRIKNIGTSSFAISSAEELYHLLDIGLIASHHGAENDKTNHVTWAAVTRPKHVVFSVGFNEGYKHPTLAATANYLITGLEEDEEDHIILIYNPTSTHAASLRGLTFVRSCYIHSNWGVFRTQKPIHSTGSSGELRYTFTEQGKLKDFWEEITTIH